MTTIETRRTDSIQWRKTSNGRSAFLWRNNHGSSMSLDTMVDSATLATITMPVAADAPPINASTASAGCACASGKLITNESGSTELGSSIWPARAMGTTNKAASIKYAGNTHLAKRKSCGSMFSTTVTWN